MNHIFIFIYVFYELSVLVLLMFGFIAYNILLGVLFSEQEWIKKIILCVMQILHSFMLFGFVTEIFLLTININRYGCVKFLS